MSILKTIYLQHLNGANANMTLDSSGRVGIGNTSPSFPLHVGGEIFSGRSDSSTEGGQISLGRASDNALHYYIDCYGGSTTPSLRFIDAAAGAVRMNIDSSGRVTMPNQPAFFAYPNTNTTLGTTTSPYIFAVTTFNRGSNYSTSTGRFTAPVAGAYHFSYGVQHNANFNDNLVVDLRVNGGQYGGVVRAEWTTGALFNMVTASATIYLNVNDYVTIDSIGGTGWGDDAWFSGHLIG